MRALAIDPGPTSGYVVLDMPDQPQYIGRPLVVHSWQGQATLRERAGLLLKWLQKSHVTRVVVEDFKIHPTSTGHPMSTSITDTIEYIGCIEAVCQLVIPRVGVHRVQPNKKGRWPPARLAAQFPDHVMVEGIHARDALVIGLVYFEVAKIWDV